MYRLFLCLVVFAVAALPALSRAEDKDPIRSDLDKAKTAHKDAVVKAETALLAALDDAIKAVAATGDLDAVKGLQAERKAFTESGKVPTAIKLKVAAGDYQRAVRQARATLDKAYEQAVKDYTKALKIDQAEAVRKEWKELQGPGIESKSPEGKGVAKADPPAGKPRWVPGRYEIRYTPNRATRTYIVRSDGSVISTDGSTELQIQIKQQGGALIIEFTDNKLERLTFADNRLFVEHFNPKSTFEENLPDQIGIGDLVKKK